jgi:hypothetical protein
MTIEKKKIKRKKKGSKSVVYFTKDTEAAIREYLTSCDKSQKADIFTKEIKPAITKLVENVIFVHRFNTIDEVDILKNDCVSFLFEVLHKFDPSKGHKAFSYLTVVAKNWFTQKIKFKKRKAVGVHFDNNVLNYLEKQNHEKVVFSYENILYRKEFLSMLKDEMKKWRKKFSKDQEKVVLEAVILLMENPDLLSIYSRKGVFIYLKEMTGLNTKQIVTNLKKMKNKYKIFKGRYDNGDV